MTAPDSATAPDNADPGIAVRLHIVVGRLTRRLRLTDNDLAPLQLSTLANIETHGPVRLGELAAREAVAAPAMTRVLASLQERNLIVRSPDPDDARSTRVSLSETGVRLLAEVRSRRTALLDARLARLSEDQRRLLAAALPALEALISEDC